MLNHFTFNGHSTGELGLLVSGINIYGSPSRVVEKVNIPYRSGDLLIDTGAYTNYMLTYTVDIMDNTKATAEAISKWLLGSKGYCELTDTYNPEIYRVASYYNQLDYTLSALYRYGKATITFDCKPQKYLTANQPVTLNPTTSEATSYSLSTPAMPLPITLEGNTTQNTLSGKNLAQLTPQTRTVNGVTVTIDSNLLVTVNGTATAGGGRLNFFSDVITLASGTYDFRKVMMSGTAQVPPYLSNSSTNTAIGWATPDGRPFTVSASTPAKIGFNFENGITYNEKFYLQLEQGSTPTAYEPYCGGIPSPNPDYPQEIHSVKGDNEIRVVGKNIFNKADGENNKNFDASGGLVSGTHFISNYISVLPNTTYYLSNVVSAYNGRSAFAYDSNKATPRVIIFSDSSDTSGTFTTGSAEVYVRVCTDTPDICQLEKGSTATTYEPYKAQVYPINLPVENLCPPLTVGIGINATNGVETQSGISATSDYIAVDFNINPSYYLSGLDDGLHSFVYSYNASKQPLLRTGGMNREEIKLTSAEFTGGTATGTGDIAYVRVTQYWLSGDNGDISAVPSLPIQLEKGSKANSYNPYGSPSIELNALGNYKDYFHKTDGKWYLHKEFDKVDMGTIEWATETTYLTGMFRTGTGSTPSVPLFAGAMACPIFIWQEGAVDFRNLKDGYMAVTNSADLPIVRVRNSIYSSYTNAQFKEAMSGIPMYYTLKTPTETEITDATLVSQLNAISKAKTYDGSTTIVQEGTDAGFKLSMPVPTEISSEYFGEPIITVNEVGTIVWNDSLIKVNSAPVTINSQTLQCYYYSENKNNDVEVNEFPKYEQGENYIGSTMALTVVPNYWKL